jgi:hypothetical protein
MIGFPVVLEGSYTQREDPQAGRGSDRPVDAALPVASPRFLGIRPARQINSCI